jgi:microcin C transport system substrate-binding protein
MIQVIRGALLLCAALYAADIHSIEYEHGYAFLAEPKYAADFEHFEYVNPDAPKGGALRVPEMGNWDTFNRMPLRGRPVAGTDSFDPTMNLLYDSLLHPALDEPASSYGKLAEGVAVADDGSFIAFKLREGAYWHDGKPVTTADVAFTWDVFINKANPTISQPLQMVERIEVLNEREIKFWISEASRGDPILPIRFGVMPVFPKHYWETRDITKTTMEPPLGSGPYRVADFDPGRWVRYERVENYWGKDLPVSRGHNNFDTIKWDYFRDDQVKTESVKGYVVDILEENLPRRWATTYNFPAVQEGVFRAETSRLTKPAGLWWPMFFNLDQPRFQDIRVREALWLCADFIWYNRRDYGFWDTATSFFHGSELAQRGLPSELELVLLEPIRDLVPPRVFTEEYKPQPYGGTGWHRDKLVKAARLLEEAGWVVEDGTLTHVDTGEEFFIRFLAVSPALAGGFIPFRRVIEKLGIDSSSKAPEIANWQYRMRAGDFDISAIAFQPPITPTRDVANSFSSATANMEYSSNYANMRDPAVDHLINAMNGAKTWEEFVAACRALDRVLLWNFYFIPGMSKVDYAFGWWDKFGIPEHGRLNHPWAAIRIWWLDEAKAARVRAFTGGR